MTTQAAPVLGALAWDNTLFPLWEQALSKPVEKTIFFPPYQQFLVWLKEERGKKRLTMRKAAGAIQVPSSWIAKVELGDRRLDVAEYVRYCIALKINPHEGIARLERDTREWLRHNKPDKP